MNEASVEVSEKTLEGAAAVPWPSSRAAYYTLFVLVLCASSNVLDSSIVPYLAASIKADLHLSDTALGLLFGVSFGLFYTVVGLPIAYFVDRYSRRWILALGLATWNIGTVLCGVAQNFAQLFMARFLVGAGEGVNGPTTYSMIGDLFPREKLPRAIAYLHLGDVVGPAIALAFGALLLHIFLGIAPIHVPFGVVHGWQIVFILIGLPSLLLVALVLFTVPEPARRSIRNQLAELHGRATVSGSRLAVWFKDYGVAIRYMNLKRGIFWPLFGSLLVSSLSLGGLQWNPIFYQRTYGWGPAKLAGLQSIAQLVVVPLGLLVSVVLAEHFSRRGRNDSAMRVYLISFLVAMPSLVYPLMPTPWLAFAIAAIGQFSTGISAVSQNAALQIATPTELRGKITALYLFIFAVIGLAFSPVLNALITDDILHNEALIRWAIFWPAIICRPLSFLIAAFGLRPYGREITRLKSLET